MKMQIGRTDPNMVSPSLDSSFGRGPDTDRRVANIVQQANQNHAAAMRVDGVRYAHWRFYPRTGRVCSCSLQEGQPGQLRPDRQEAPPLGQGSQGVTSVIQVRGEQETFQSSLQQRLQERILARKGELPLPPTTTTERDNDPNTEEVELDMSPESLLREPTSLWGGDKQRCGICFGSGYEQSYQLQCGQRVLLTPRASNYVCEGAASVESGSKPWRFRISDGGSVVWTLDALGARQTVWGMAVLDNLEPAQNALLEYEREPGVWASLHPLLLPDTGTFRVRVRQAKPRQETVFSHVEWSVQTVELPYMQMAPWRDESSSDFFESLATNDFEISVENGPMTRESFVYDLKYGKLWRIQTVSQKMLGDRTPYGWEFYGRIVQRSEQAYQLVNLFTNQYIR